MVREAKGMRNADEGPPCDVPAPQQGGGGRNTARDAATKTEKRSKIVLIGVCRRSVCVVAQVDIVSEIDAVKASQL